MESSQKGSSSLEEGTLDSIDLEHEDAVQNFLEYEKISDLRISGWENFYHVKRKDKKEDDAGLALVTLNKGKYIERFMRLIEEKGEWEDEDEIAGLAQKEFEKVNQEFGERYKRIMDLPPHPCLPKVFDVNKDKINGLYFAELEYVSGTPFLNVVLSPFQILGLVKNLLEGLEHMHNYTLLHRRIKSENVYIRFEGTKPTVKFTSWGLALPIEKAQGDRSGSKHYVAPEVLFQGKVSERADLWAIGSLLYQALTGEPPYPERSSARNLKELLNIANNEKTPNELKVYEHFQKLSVLEKEELKLDKLQELVFELLKPDPEKRVFDTARKVIAFIQINWPKVILGAPEIKETMTFTPAY